ncbi:MAG: hypothetical protein RL189_2954 [Pseudomonadota bacterium]|jgi:hypothetical protein
MTFLRHLAKRFIPIGIVAALVSVKEATATVIVRNGGDVIDSFLAQTRESLIQVVAPLADDAHISQLASRCHKLSFLNSAEQDFCEEFVRSAVPQIFTLNRGALPTPFKLVLEPLVMPDTDGALRPVAAATDCGTAGPILFHYDTVRTYSPKQLFFVLAHEFAHKISFQGLDCVTDNDPVGPFGAAGGGRRLIDAFATVLAEAAVERGQIGEDYAIFDNFSCTMFDERSGVSLKSRPSVERIVFDKGRFDQYQTGIGHLPRDSFCSIESRHWNWKYALRMTIKEPAGCRLSEKTQERVTIVRVMREYDPLPDGRRPQSEEVASQTLANVNPICDAQPRQITIPFSHELGTATFTINYLNTQTIGNRSLTGFREHRNHSLQLSQ